MTTLASVSLQEGGELDHLRSLTEKRDWEPMSKLNDWMGITDNVILFALRCPHGGVALFELFDPFEPFSNFRLLEVQTLTSEESHRFLETADREWKTFQEAIESDHAATAS